MFLRVLAVLLLVTVVSVLTLPLQPRPAADRHAAFRAAFPDADDATRQKRGADDDDNGDDLAAEVRGEGQLRFRRNAPEDGEDLKRAFQPWGGKRQAEVPEATWDALGDDDESALVAARAFNPWGGKRSELGDALKRKFQPWGGKRQAPSVEDLKRRFNPWAGKRSGSEPTLDDMLPEVDDDELTEKRAFQPWGGKRASFQPWGGKRASFQPWGGKRASFQPWGGKRASFQPWGGKRASFQPWGGKRASFQPWGGKRASFQPWGGKRASFQPWGGKRASFQPWGGKRSAMGYDEELEEEEQKRQAFQAWGGKRSTDTDSAMSELYSTGDLN